MTKFFGQPYHHSPVQLLKKGMIPNLRMFRSTSVEKGTG